MKRDPLFPFWHLGLRCNPFRALADDEWTAVALPPPGLDFDAAAAVPDLQILGPMGAGKSTGLLALLRQLQAAERRAAYEYLPPGQSHFRSDLRELDVLLLDEAQRLRRGERQRLLSAGPTRLVLASHADWTPQFCRAGRPLRSVGLEGQPVALRRAAMERRLAFFALPGAPVCRLNDALVERLARCFGANLRAADHLMYEVFQQLQHRDALTPDVVEQQVHAMTGDLAP